MTITLFASWAYGFTLNRVSLFALIFSIGILVDDAIVIAESVYSTRKQDLAKEQEEWDDNELNDKPFFQKNNINHICCFFATKAQQPPDKPTNFMRYLNLFTLVIPVKQRANRNL